MSAAAIHLVVDSGPRGVIDVQVEGVTVPMLVHANAGFTVMLTHDALHRINGTRVDKEYHFGLGADLGLSELGRGSTALRSLTVADSRLNNVRCEVFQLPTTNWEGMLGVGWLATVQPIVDLANRQLFIPTMSQRADVDALLGTDATRIDLSRDQTSGRFVLRLSVGPATQPTATQTTATFVASTVADTILDIEYARRCGIELGPVIGEEHGPTGAVVANYRSAQPVTFHSSGTPIATATPEVHDVYAYSGSERPPGIEAIGGYLGADLLLATGALLDFG